jgi:hypothetical protein
MIKSLLAATALVIGLAGMSATAEAKMMMKHHGPAMCYHTMKGKKHYHACMMKPMHHHMVKKMKKM